jgi:hypothetical protein
MRTRTRPSRSTRPARAPSGSSSPSVFDDMLKKSCPYHKTPVNHTLEQCDMLKKYYSRVVAKEDEAKKDGGDGGAGDWGGGGGRHVQQPAQAGAARGPCRGEGSSFLDWSEDAITFTARITRTASPTQATTRWSSIPSSATRGSPRC